MSYKLLLRILILPVLFVNCIEEENLYVEKIEFKTGQKFKYAISMNYFVDDSLRISRKDTLHREIVSVGETLNALSQVIEMKYYYSDELNFETTGYRQTRNGLYGIKSSTWIIDYGIESENYKRNYSCTSPTPSVFKANEALSKLLIPLPLNLNTKNWTTNYGCGGDYSNKVIGVTTIKVQGNYERVIEVESSYVNDIFNIQSISYYNSKGLRKRIATNIDNDSNSSSRYETELISIN